MRHDAGQAAVRADRLEDGAARSSLLPGRRLPEGSGVLRRAHELEDPERRRQAGGARHRRLGRSRPARRLSGAAAAAGDAPPAVRGRGGRGGAPRAPAPRRVRRLLLGHRAVGREEGRSGAAKARAHAGGRQPRLGLPELPREGSGRLRSADQQRQPEEPAAGRRPTARRPRRRRSRRPTGRRSGSITSRSRCSNYKETVAFYTALLGWKPGTDEGSQNQCQIGDVGDIIIRRGSRRRGAPTALDAARDARRSVTSRSASRRSIRIR